MLKPLKNTKHARGFTLIELMIGLLISTLLIGSAIMMLSSTIKHNHETMNSIHLQQELQGVLELMSSDIRRHGYWASADTDIDANANTNPFMGANTDLSINAGQNCILISYDSNADGTLPAVNAGTDDKRYGYRLSGTSIQSRPSIAAYSCTTASSNWEDLTDPSTIIITQLQFVPTQNTIDLDGADSGTASIMIRNIDITVTGHHIDQPTISRTLSYRVRLRNDKFNP